MPRMMRPVLAVLVVTCALPALNEVNWERLGRFPAMRVSHRPSISRPFSKTQKMQNEGGEPCHSKSLRR